MPIRSRPRTELPFSAERAAACLTALLASAGAAAQQCESVCSDPSKTCICVVAPPDAQFGLTRVGAQLEQGRVGLALNPGDQITNSGAETIVELACPGGSEVKLHGAFHAVVLPSSEGQDCAFNLLDGSAEVLARMPTSLDAGEAVMGSITTQYGMRVSRGVEMTRFECVVFEGVAQVRYGQRQPFDLAESRQTSWTLGRQPAETQGVTGEAVAAAARIYARTDVARLAARGEQPADAAALLEQLSTAYTSVLARPRDVDARARMASLQASVGNSRQVLYQVEQAERIDPAGTQRNADLAEFKYGAYLRLGQQDNANAQAERIRTIDPERLNRLRGTTQFQRQQPLRQDVQP